MKKTVLSTFALAASAALVMIGATPASAAGSSIDPGDSLYAINCDTQYFNWQLLSVDAPTAFSTKIGTGEGYDEQYFACAGQPAWDASTGNSYYIQRHLSEGDETFLASIDVTTGVSSTIGEFFYEADGTFYPDVEAIAIGKDGAAFALFDGELFSLDLTTAELTHINSTLSGVWAFAANPTTGDFYVVDSDGYTYRFDVTNGALNYLGQVALDGDEGVFSLQIDEAGTFWIQVSVFVEASPTLARLYSFTEATIEAPVLSGQFIDDPYFTRAILIIPGDVEPALADTGADLTVAPIAAGLAGILTLLGAVVLVTRRRRTA